jgi:hypothetical protein
VIVPLRPPSRAPSRGAKRTALTGRARKGTISEAPPRVRGARAPWGTGAIGDRGAFQRKGGGGSVPPFGTRDRALTGAFQRKGGGYAHKTSIAYA